MALKFGRSTVHPIGCLSSHKVCDSTPFILSVVHVLKLHYLSCMNFCWVGICRAMYYTRILTHVQCIILLQARLRLDPTVPSDVCPVSRNLQYHWRALYGLPLEDQSGSSRAQVIPHGIVIRDSSNNYGIRYVE